MLRKNLLLFLIFGLLGTNELFSQSAYQKILKVSLESGPLISNGTDWGNQVKEIVNYHAVDVQLGWRKSQNSTYNYLYRYPVLGVGFNSTLTYNGEIGRPMSLYGFFNVPFSVKGIDKKFQFGYFNQLGVGFNLKPYDPDNNPNNQYIGSKVNCYIYLGAYSTYKISDRVDLMASFGLKHFSNGSTKRPNAGINLVPLNLGVNFKLGELKSISREAPFIEKKELESFWNFALYTGVKNYAIGAPTYFRGGVGVNYLIEPNYKYRFGLGMDLFYAQGMSKRYPGEKFSFHDQTSLALVGSWEWQLTEKLYVPIGLGVYLYHNEANEEGSKIYERVGVRYRVTEHLFAGVQIKAHKAKADFFEFTLGYTLPTR